MAFSIRNLKKFLEDNPAFSGKEEEIMIKAKELAGEDNSILSGSAAETILDPEWVKLFFQTITTDLEHLTMGIEDLKASR